METINIFRSDRSDCWKGDLEDALEIYTDQELAAIRKQGYTAIWLHQKLSDYTPSRVFPTFGYGSKGYLSTIRALIARAAQHSLEVYLYLLEPRAVHIADPFWQENEDVKGQYWMQPVYDREFYALCSSHPKVQEYLFDSMQLLVRELPGLGGFFAISSGEDFSTCACKLWSAESWDKSVGKALPRSSMESNFTCSRCAQRPLEEPIAEVLNTLWRGIQSAQSSCKLLAWDWGWERLPGAETERKIVSKLDPGIILMSDFEIGGAKEVLGQERYIDEYSLGYVGPSPRFQEKMALARASGQRIAAKLQVGTTHELCTVPNLPLIHNLYRKLEWLNANGVDAALATWNMGNMRTLNTYLFGQSFGRGKAFNRNFYYNKLIPEYLDVTDADLPLLEQAWSHFESAMDAYPYGGKAFVYFGPINYAPTYWLPPRKTQGTSLGIACDTMERGDDLRSCLDGYTCAEIISCFQTFVKSWERGLVIYQQVLNVAVSPRAHEELRTAQCINHVFLSGLHIFKAFELCENWTEDKLPDYLELCRAERANCVALVELLRTDARLGFHPECQQYMFDEKMVLRKIVTLNKYLNGDLSWMKKADENNGKDCIID